MRILPNMTIPAHAAVLSLTAALALAGTASAHSLQPGQCYARDAFNQTLIAEGMRTLVVGNRTGIQNAPGTESGVRGVQFINGVAGNLESRKGYVFQGNRPRGEPSDDICITAALEGIALNDNTDPNIPRAAYLGGRFNDAVNRSAAEGMRPMVIANTVFVEGGKPRRGLPVVVFGHSAERRGVISTLTPNGTPTSLGDLTNLEYTPIALEHLGRKDTQVASPR